MCFFSLPFPAAQDILIPSTDLQHVGRLCAVISHFREQYGVSGRKKAGYRQPAGILITLTMYEAWLG